MAQSDCQELQSLKPLYALDFDAELEDENNDFITQKGLVVLRVQPTSFAGNIIKRLFSLFLRETSI